MLPRFSQGQYKSAPIKIHLNVSMFSQYLVFSVAEGRCYLLQNGACYIRVSTEDQIEFSPDAQLKAIRNYAGQNNILLAEEHIYMDEGISGRKAEKRPQFMKMIATAKSKPKPFDMILVHKFDRFARSREDSVVYKSLLKKECGIKVVSITESIEDDKFSVILEAMLEAMAEYYSLNLSEEVKKGMTEKAQRGQFQSNPPFGYTMKNKQLMIVPHEAELVAFAFRKFAFREMNMKQLAVYANQLGFKTHRGNLFETRTFEYMFHNPVYIGKVRWTPSGKRGRNDHPDTIIRDSAHEPLVPFDEWEKVQERLQENKQIYRKREKNTTSKRSWLCGLVHCANCGYTLSVYQRKYMQCGGYAKAKCLVSCSVSVQMLESLILEKIKNAYPGKIEINVVFPQTDRGAGADEALLRESLEKLGRKEMRIKDAYQDGIDTLEEYKANKKRVAEERDTLLRASKGLRERLSEAGPSDQEKHKSLASVYDLLTDEMVEDEIKYKTAHFLIDEIIYAKTEKVLKIIYKI